jgi:predicted nucleic acid-binding protein
LIIDTDVIIWELKGNEKAKEIIQRNAPFKISVVTYMEVVQGMRNKKELACFLKQLSNWKVEIIHIDHNISTRAMIFVEEYFLSNSMELGDALIAASCIDNSEIILTCNDKHYKHIPNIQIRKFNPN